MNRFVHGQHIVPVLVLILATALCICGAEGATCSLVPVGLRCEFSDNPLGVDVPNPRLSWKLESAARAQAQTAYQILVAFSPNSLAHEKGELWDSGKVLSKESIGLSYHGRLLKSSQLAFWRVRVWDQVGRVSDWSQPAKLRESRVSGRTAARQLLKLVRDTTFLNRPNKSPKETKRITTNQSHC